MMSRLGWWWALRGPVRLPVHQPPLLALREEILFLNYVRL